MKASKALMQLRLICFGLPFSVTNYFLVNLSVADLLVTLVCMPMAIWNAYTMLWNFGELTCKIVKYLQGKFPLITALAMAEGNFAGSCSVGRE